jgi:hypothetical protein
LKSADGNKPVDDLYRHLVGLLRQIEVYLHVNQPVEQHDPHIACYAGLIL